MMIHGIPSKLNARLQFLNVFPQLTRMTVMPRFEKGTEPINVFGQLRIVRLIHHVLTQNLKLSRARLDRAAH